MMKKYLMMLAAIFCCAMMSTMLTACSESDDDDENVPAKPVETPSTVDNGKWLVTDEHMDKSYRPGDDFFMYCNGGWWTSTEVDETTMMKALIIGQSQEWVTKSEAALNIPSKVKMLADLEKTDSQAVDVQKKKLQEAIDRVNAVNTKEEAWRLLGQLCKEGYNTPFRVMSFSRAGKIALCLFPISDKDYDTPAAFMSDDDLAWQLASNPDVLAAMHPLGSALRRTINQEQWPMLVNIFEALGVSLDDAYSMEAYPTIVQNGMVEMIVTEFTKLQDKSVEEWKTMIISKLKDDAPFFDDVAFSTDLANSPMVRKDMLENFFKRYLKYEISCAFAKAYVTDDMKKRTREFCEELRQTFRERIQANSWMSEGSKRNATEKLNEMVFNIGAPDKWIEEGIADLSQEQNLFDDIRALRRAQLKLDLKLAGMNTKEACFHQIIQTYPLTLINAFYVPNTNSMNIYPSWLVEPCYNTQHNQAHNYATMSSFGHEITHGFDTTGSMYNKIGDFEDIWATEADRQEFNRRAQLLIDYYSKFDVMPFDLGLTNNGAVTVPENIADLGGFCLAYDTYVKYLKNNGYKDEQLRQQKLRFYEAYSYLWCTKWTAGYTKLLTLGDANRGMKPNEHSLPRERVNGIVTNTDDWYDLFEVKTTDKLYLAPENRIRIW
jgi:predicted metalloendopeptidase